MTLQPRAHQLYLLRPPYRLMIPISGLTSVQQAGPLYGAGLIWCMGSSLDPDLVRALRRRPGGLPLIIVLPRVEEVERPQDVFRLVDQCRPADILPYHEDPSPLDLQALLARQPGDLPGAVVEYLGWRGLVLDMDLRRTVRRILELSVELKTVSGLARGLYMSRRALGRRFLREGLPVPSHWLQFGRVLRAALRMQMPGTTLMSVAYEHEYPDGFSLSNQMKRLTGLRPSDIAPRLGWEWIVEAWIQEEVRTGGFRADQAQLLIRGRAKTPLHQQASADERQPA